MSEAPAGAFDELPAMRLLRGADDLLIRGAGLAEGDILAHGALLYPRVLKHHAEAGAQRVARKRTDPSPSTLMLPPSTS